MKSAMYFGEVRMSKIVVRVSVIKELIRKRGLTKDEFIKRSGMSHGTFYNTDREMYSRKRNQDCPRARRFTHQNSPVCLRRITAYPALL